MILSIYRIFFGLFYPMIFLGCGVEEEKLLRKRKILLAFDYGALFSVLV